MTMTATVLKPQGPAVQQLVLVVILAVVARLRRLARAFKHRREARVLGKLDDRMLSDIGLTRSDVRDAYAQPLWDDPTALLRARALERRLSHNGISLGLPEVDASEASVLPQTSTPHYPSADRAARYLQ